MSGVAPFWILLQCLRDTLKSEPVIVLDMHVELDMLKRDAKIDAIIRNSLKQGK